MRIDVYVHVVPSTFESRVLELLGTIKRDVSAIQATEIQTMNELTTLEAKVAEVTTTEQSAIVLLTDLHQKLSDALASGDPARLQAVIDSLGSSKDALAAAVVANT